MIFQNIVAKYFFCGIMKPSRANTQKLTTIFAEVLAPLYTYLQQSATTKSNVKS